MSVRDRWKYSRLRPKNTATYTRYRNWLSTRYHARGNGRAPLPDRVSRAATSRTPVVRNRINPATGRPRWTDRSRADLARWQEARPQSRAVPQPIARNDREGDRARAQHSRARSYASDRLRERGAR